MPDPSRFKIGDTVLHKHYGRGVITDKESHGRKLNCVLFNDSTIHTWLCDYEIELYLAE